MEFVMKIKVVAFALLIVLLSFPIRAFAQSSGQKENPAPQHEIVVTGDQATFTFSDLGVVETRLFSPVDSTRILFSVPSNWRLASGGMLELHFDVLLSGLDLAGAQGVTAIVGGDLIIRFNGVIIGVINAGEAGSFVRQFPIPDEALVSIREDGRHTLLLDFDAQMSCYYDLEATVIIKPTSSFDLYYQEDSPQLDFTRLPSPFYLNNSILPESTLLVVPDNPDQLELQAAMNVAAGLGSIIDDEYNLQMVNYGALDDVRRAQNHLIFVGLAEQFGGLSDVDFNIPIRDGAFEGLPGESSNDGILQLALSPWNPAKAVLLVSGNTLDALSKAAFALSSGSVFVYQNPTVAYVSSVQFLQSDIPFVERFTLEDLGYDSETLSGVGTTSIDFPFYVSKNQTLSREGYFELFFLHSGALEYSASSFSLYLNDELFYTGAFSQETAQATSVQVRIPPGFLRFGENLLEVEASMLVLPSCDAPFGVDQWFTILNQSLFFLPAADRSQPAQVTSPDLKFFNELFTTNSDLGDVTFVVPRTDPVAWQIASRLSYMFGEITGAGISNLKVVYGDSVDEEVRSNASLIVVGKPSDIPFLSEINDQLPAPFDFDNNTASERQLQVVYRIPEGQNVGYLELMQSPYNAEKFIGLVSGNTSEGVVIAGNTLLLSDLQDQLAGVFAVTNGVAIASGNASSLFSIVGQGVPEAEQIINSPVVVNQGQGGAGQFVPPVWLLAFIGVSVLVVVGVAIYAIRSLARKDKARKVEAVVEAGPSDREDQDGEK
jgi:hypothetical protein